MDSFLSCSVVYLTSPFFTFFFSCSSNFTFEVLQIELILMVAFRNKFSSFVEGVGFVSFCDEKLHIFLKKNCHNPNAQAKFTSKNLMAGQN